MTQKFFQINHTSKKSKARIGEIHTDHGIIKTPAFIAAATKGTIKSLTPSLVKKIGIQAGCVNTYHLVTHPGADIIEKAGGIHEYSKLQIPLMSDSGGFQVFSLARKNKSDIHASNLSERRNEDDPLVVKISEDGVKFRSVFDGTLLEFTPEKSIEYQRKIGADLNMAFDECTYYPATHQYAEKAMERTHEWLLRCIAFKNKSEIRNPRFAARRAKSEANLNSNFEIRASNFSQFLYGIIQGGTFKDLRIKSAKFVIKQEIDGVAIGGVSVGESKYEMRKQVAWVSPFLPKNKPVHLLGVGQIDDIIDLVRYGIDTFDCVEPTRIARMGSIYQLGQILSRVSFPPVLESKHHLRAVGIPETRATCPSFNIDILKGKYKIDLSPVDESCDCYVCANFTKSYLHHLFKQKELLAYTLATYHNLYVMEKLFDNIRELIVEDKL